MEQMTDKNQLYKLISDLIQVGFRGSAQEVMDYHIMDYYREVKGVEIEVHLRLKHD